MSRFNPEESAAILNEADWEALTDLLDGKADTNSDGWKNLVDLGFIGDEESLTDGAERLFAGLFQRSHMIQLTRIAPSEDVKRITLTVWISSTDVTWIVPEGDSMNLFRSDPEEVPSLILRWLVFGPHMNVFDGPLHLPSDVIRLARQGDVDQLQRVIASECRGHDDTGFGKAGLEGTWAMNVFDIFAAVDEQMAPAGSLLFLSTPTCLYAMDGTKADELEVELAGLTSPLAWQMINPYLFA